MFSTQYLVLLGQVLNVTVHWGEKLDIMEFAVFVHFEDSHFNMDNLICVWRHQVPRALGSWWDAAGIVCRLDRRHVGHFLGEIWICPGNNRGLSTTSWLEFGNFFEGSLPTRSLDLVVCHKLFQLIYIFRAVFVASFWLENTVVCTWNELSDWKHTTVFGPV